ncbi:hypothetical protein [Chitinophaga nivalis]|uniref:Lipoprotein n=1 Tax=Chitinophaga nivalis TaxID=2991709 RepID=A0ABT3ISL5_9BACT|nr:hypothetical protein [Chitinophaga nivalis]MCW3463595.1 hypothetical protein [Chitinophaga nivalis]MCW3486715.1 hypothetical protein [Chitinophaga nivalis]
MKRFLLVILAIGILAACKNKQKSGDGTKEPMTLADFQALFTPGTLPYKLAADSLQLKLADSLALDTAAVRQFLTDTLTTGTFGRNEKVKIFPLQRISGAVVDYLVLKVAGKNQTTGYLCFLDKKGKYLSRIRVANTGSSDGTTTSFNLDSKNVLKINTEKKLTGSRTALKEDFFMINNDGSITLIMTNSNGPTTPGQIFNPIDTLPRKHKFSGDYTSGEMNIVSIRDGEDAKTFQFFITFSKDNGNCKGELSGKGTFIAGNRGEFKDKESSCGLSFQFSNGRVSIREIGGCGAYRGIKCFFEGGFVKKAEKKKKK